jgi:hypothetical protein
VKPITLSGFTAGLTTAPAVLFLLYATGFVVVFNAQGQLGLSAAHVEFFRLKYLHVGVLATVFVFPFAGLAFVLLLRVTGGHTPAERSVASRRLTYFHILVTASIVFGLYVRMTLAEMSSLGRIELTTLLIFVSLGLLVAFLHTGDPALVRADRGGMRITRVALSLTAVLYLAFELLNIATSRTLYSPSAWLLATLVLGLFSAFIGAVIYRVHYRVSQGTGRWLVLLAIPFVAFFYYLVVWGFGALVYPYIPEAKGGGDFAGAPSVRICGAPPKDSGVRDVPYVVLFETESTIYLAEREPETTMWGKPFLVGMGQGSENLRRGRPKRVIRLFRSNDIALVYETGTIPDEN